MTVYSLLTISGTEVVDTYNYQVSKSISDNNTSSSFTADINNFAGINSNKFTLGNNVQVYADTNLIYSAGSPLSQWTLNGTGSDTFNLFNGNFIANTSGINWTVGKIRNCLSCSGPNQDSLLITDTSGNELNFNSGTSFSFCAWVQWNGNNYRSGLAYNAGIVGRSYNYCIDANLDSPTGIPLSRFGVRRTGTTTMQTVTTGSLLSGLWTHITGVFDANTKYIYLYNNANLLGSTDASNVGFTGSTNFYIGRNAGPNNGDYTGWAGNIDDVRVYNKALTAGDIYNIYNLGNGTESINNGSQLIFNGILEDIRYEGEPMYEHIKVEGRDYMARLMDRVIEPETYTNWEVGSIVRDIISKYTDDITTNNVQTTTTTLARISYNQTPVFDAIKSLADQAGFIFYIDNNKDLHFEPESSIFSGYTFNSGNVLKADFEERRDTIYNQVWIYGDRYLDGFKETFVGLGPAVGSTYTLLYNPNNTEVSVDGTIIQPGAILGITTTTVSGAKYVVNYDDKQIIFTSGTNLGNNIQALNTSVVINYKRALPIIKVGDNEISKSMYGTRIEVIQNKDIKDPVTAQALLVSELTNKSSPVKEGNLDIKGVVNVTPSQTATVNLPYHNVNNQTYSIIEAKYNFDKEKNLSEEVLSVKVNKKLLDVTDSLKQLILDLKRLQSGDITTTDIYTRYQYTTGSLGVRQSGCYVYTRYVGSDYIWGTNNGPAGGNWGSAYWNNTYSYNRFLYWSGNFMV